MSTKYTSPSNRMAYYSLVWETVRKIPSGKVATYGQIAALIPPPEGMSESGYAAWGPRWVGGAMAACPEDVPWQRVINAQGKISLRRGSQEQRARLESEGVVFDEHDRVDLSRYGWSGQPNL